MHYSPDCRTTRVDARTSGREFHGVRKLLEPLIGWMRGGKAETGSKAEPSLHRYEPTLLATVGAFVHWISDILGNPTTDTSALPISRYLASAFTFARCTIPIFSFRILYSSPRLTPTQKPMIIHLQTIFASWNRLPFCESPCHRVHVDIINVYVSSYPCA